MSASSHLIGIVVVESLKRRFQFTLRPGVKRGNLEKFRGCEDAVEELMGPIKRKADI